MMCLVFYLLAWHLSHTSIQTERSHHQDRSPCVQADEWSRIALKILKIPPFKITIFWTLLLEHMTMHGLNPPFVWITSTKLASSSDI